MNTMFCVIFKLLCLLLCVFIMDTCVYTFHGLCVAARGGLCGICSLLWALCGFWRPNPVTKLQSKHFHPLSHLVSPVNYFKVTCPGKKKAKQNKSIGSCQFQHLWIMNIIFKPSPNQSLCEINSPRSNLFTIIGEKIPWIRSWIIKWLRACMQCQSCLHKENDLFPEPLLLWRENETVSNHIKSTCRLRVLKIYLFLFYVYCVACMSVCVPHVYNVLGGQKRASGRSPWN